MVSLNLKKLTRNPIFLGVLIGILSALIQALTMNAGGPPAYGFCVACHTRDLVNDIANGLGADPALGVAPISANSVVAVLTMVGVVIGGLAASKLNKEFKWKNGKPIEYLLYFVGGIAVLVFALLLGGCPYRAALRFGYGDLVALIGIIAMACGVFVGVYHLKKRMEAQI